MYGENFNYISKSYYNTSNRVNRQKGKNFYGPNNNIRLQNYNNNIPCKIIDRDNGTKKKQIISQININKGLYNKQEKNQKPIRNPSNAIMNREDFNKLENFQPLFQPLDNKKNQNITFNKNVSVATRKKQQFPSIRKKVIYMNGTIGLINRGNTCYLNSALQNLKNIYPLTAYLLENYKSFDIYGFTYKYCELIANMINQDSDRCYDPINFIHKFVEVAPMFTLGQQNDSNFCILYILSLIERETKNFIGIKPYDPIKYCKFFTSLEEMNKYNEFRQKMKQKRNSCIIDFFYGFQEERYKCNNVNCKYINYTFQGISVLNLPIMTQYNSPIGSLEEAIEYYQKEQKHFDDKDFFCSICRKKLITTETIIISLPKIFIINFKRIGEYNFYSHNLKIPDILRIKDKIKDEGYEYDLFGLIKHLGGSNSGHNIAICRNFFDNFWYVYDDYRVTEINNTGHALSNNKLDTSNGFLFFYIKKGEDPEFLEKCKNSIIEKSAELRK